MNKREFWKLTVHYFPRAAEAGVHPVEAEFGDVLCLAKDEHPEWYVSHVFYFDKAPSRDDFRALMRSTPWTSVWDDTLFPIMNRNAFPIIDWMHKSGSVDLIDDQGRTVGRIDIDREHAYVNTGIDRNCAVSYDVIDKAIRHLPQPNRAPAKELICNNEDLIKERALDRQKAFVDDKFPYCPIEDHILREINRLLYENGLRKTKPKRSTTCIES